MRIFVIVTLFVTLLITTPAAAQRGPADYRGMADEILRYVNQHRRGMGLDTLMMNEIVLKAAEQHTRNMAQQKIPFGHYRFDERMEQLGRKIPSTGWAENVASGQRSARSVVDMWLKSEGHKKNIEGRYKLTGIGIARGTDGSLYFTQIFINQRR